MNINAPCLGLIFAINLADDLASYREITRKDEMRPLICYRYTQSAIVANGYGGVNGN